jgi:inorganic triphosphatase YgiF
MSERPERREVELKLSVDPSLLSVLREAAAIRPAGGTPTVKKRLESVYFDTPARDLHRRSLALRVRRSGHSFVQTLKSGEGGAVMDRGEWETPVPSLSPDIPRLTLSAPGAVASSIPADSLEPVFTSKINRELRIVEGAGGMPGRVEVALDQGVVEGAGRSVPVSEIELELLEGPTEALYSLALALNELAPVRVEPRSKSARGYDLIAEGPPAWRKAGVVALARDMTVDDALAAVARHCLDHLVANEAAAMDGRDAEGVHQMRVALRRLRSAIAVFDAVIPADQLDWLREETARLADGLGAARDWDVFLAETLAPVEAVRPADAPLREVRAAAEAMRAGAYETARAAIADRRTATLVLRLGAWIEGRGWRPGTPAPGLVAEPIAHLAEGLLERRHAAVLKRGRRFARLGAAKRHKVRIALKKLRYAAEFFRELYEGRRAKPYLSRLSHIQDSMGLANDLAVAERLVARLAEAPAGDAVLAARGAGTVIGWQAHAAKALEPSLVRDWKGFSAARPFWKG